MKSTPFGTPSFKATCCAVMVHVNFVSNICESFVKCKVIWFIELTPQESNTLAGRWRNSLSHMHRAPSILPPCIDEIPVAARSVDERI